MKSALIMGLLTLATSAMACPNLTGEYTCTGDKGSAKMSITQTGEKKFTLNLGQGGEFSLDANGEKKEDKIQFGQNVLLTSIVTTCEEASMKALINVTTTTAGYNQIVDIRYDFTKTDSKSMQVKLSIDKTTNGTPEIKESGALTCTK